MRRAKGTATIKLVLQDTRIDDALARCIAIEERFLLVEQLVERLQARIALYEENCIERKKRPIGGSTREP